MKLLHTLIVIAVVVAGAARAGDAKPRILVTPIASDSGGEVAKALSGAIAEDFAVVSSKDAKAAVKSIGGLDEDASDKDFGKLADAASADAVVAGKLDTKGDAKILRVKLFVKGKKTKKFSVQFGNPKSEKFKKTLHATLVDKLGTLSEGDGDADADAAPPPKKTKKKPAADDTAGDDDAAAVKPMTKVKKKKPAADDDATADDADAAPKKTKKKKPAADDADADSADGADADADAAPAKKKKSKKKKVADDDEAPSGGGEGEGAEGGEAPAKLAHAPNRDAVRVDFGIGVANRTLTFNARKFTDNLGPPKPYSNSPVPAGHIAAEIFPLAFGDAHKPQAGLGFWGDFDKTISLTLQSQQADMTVVKAKATQQRWSIGAGYRILFSQSDLAPSVTVGLNYGRQQFTVDRSGLMGAMIDLPDTSYKMIEPMANVRFPLVPAVALVANVRGQLITDTGDISKADQYGQAKVFGIQLEGGLDITFAQKFALRAMGYFGQVGYTLKGTGEQANDRDGDPSTKDVFGVRDRSIGGTVTLGVMY